MTDIAKKAARFAQATPGARRLLVGPTLADAEYRYFPSLGRHLVRNLEDPLNGFDTRDQAKAAAQTYRASCAAFARSHLPASS